MSFDYRMSTSALQTYDIFRTGRCKTHPSDRLQMIKNDSYKPLNSITKHVTHTHVFSVIDIMFMVLFLLYVIYMYTRKEGCLYQEGSVHCLHFWKNNYYYGDV